MTAWLADNLGFLSALLVTVALLLGFLWWKTKRRAYALGSGGALALLGVAYLVSLVSGESDRQQLERKINEMAAAVTARDLDRIFSGPTNQG